MFDIQFDPEMGIWSPFVYWYVVVNAFVCAGFTLVVVIGGIFDLQFLFRALREEVADETDDGRVVNSKQTGAPSDVPTQKDGND